MRFLFGALFILILLFAGCTNNNSSPTLPTQSPTPAVQTALNTTENLQINKTLVEKEKTIVQQQGNTSTTMPLIKSQLSADEYYNLSDEMYGRIYKTHDFYNSTLGALEYVNKAIALEPDYIQAYLLRSSIYSALGNSTVAFDEVNGLVNAYPENSEIYAARCNDHYSVTLAIRDCDYAIKLNPNVSYYYSYRAYQKAYNIDHQGGISDLSQAMRLDSENLNNFAALCRIKTWRRNSISFSKEYLTALPDCDKYLNEYPYDPSTLMTRGLNKLMIHNLSGAIDDYKLSVDLYSQYENQTGANFDASVADGYYSVGRALVGQGKYSESIDYFNKAIEIRNKTTYDPLYLRSEPEKFWEGVDSSFAAYYFYRGVAEYRLNQTEAARIDLDHANLLDKSFDDYVLAKGVLDSRYAPRYEIPYYVD